MFDMTGSVTVITGASGGLGVQFAQGVARQGGDLALLARRKEKLDEVAEQIRNEYGVRVLTVPTDVTVLADVVAAVEAVGQEYGRADVLVNNAGAGGVVPASDMTDEQWEYDISLDLTATFRVTREFMNALIKHSDRGRVINIASIYGLVGNTALPSSAYHAAKGGVINLTRALAAEWASTGVTVNTISPGYFETELTSDTLNSASFQAHLKRSVPLGRYGQSGELNTALVFLAARESGYITGQNIVVDGGYTCV